MKGRTRVGMRRRAIGCALSALAAFAVASNAAESASTAKPPAGHSTAAAKKAATAAPVKLVDINKASRAELKALPGIGDAEANKIIAKRPFLTKADLVTLNILPEGIYVSIKNQIVATQSGKLPLKK